MTHGSEAEGRDLGPLYMGNVEMIGCNGGREAVSDFFSLRENTRSSQPGKWETDVEQMPHGRRFSLGDS